MSRSSLELARIPRHEEWVLSGVDKENIGLELWHVDPETKNGELVQRTTITRRSLVLGYVSLDQCIQDMRNLAAAKQALSVEQSFSFRETNAKSNS